MDATTIASCVGIEMSNFIDRDELIKNLQEYKFESTSISADESETKGYNDGIDLSIVVISKFPSVERIAKIQNIILTSIPPQSIFICSNCGNKVNDSYNYCPSCGSKLEWSNYD